MNDTLVLLLSFGLVAIAAHRIGHWAGRVGMPHITGYLAAGALAGSFGLALIPTEAAADLRWLDEMALAVIAFVAGSELHLPDLRPRLRTVGRIATSVVGIGLLLLVPAVWLVAGFVDADGALGTDGRLAVAILGAVVLLALSPPSTIAVIRDARAQGNFTSTILSVTILMDVVVVVLFAAGTSVAAALLQDAGLDVGFVAVLLVDLALAVGAGLLVGRGLARLTDRRIPWPVQVAGVLAAGFAVYEAATAVKGLSDGVLGVALHLEPLLVCMVAGFTVTNRTDRREAFDHLLHDISPSVYVAFFALTGLGLKLDILLDVLPAAAALFLVRLGVLYLGAKAARPGDKVLRRWSWMGLVTQAGIALGLAREATVQFPELGASFATLVIAVVVLNEVFGPLFLRRALERAGDARSNDGTGAVLLHGLDRRGLALADRLAEDGWQVQLSDSDPEVVADLRTIGREVEHLAGDIITIGARLDERIDPVDVAVLAAPDDDNNLAVARAVLGHGNGVRLVARVHDPEVAAAFAELDAIVIDHTSAVAGLLEQAVRTPAAVRLVLPGTQDRQVAQLSIPADWHDRELRHVRLPEDLLVLEVQHGDATIVPDGFTRLRRGDVLTVVGDVDSLHEARVRFALGGDGHELPPLIRRPRPIRPSAPKAEDPQDDERGKAEARA